MATKPKELRTKFLTIRLTPREHKAFSVKADTYGGPTFVLRELVVGFTEDRTILKPPVTRKENLYHE
jgi:hypothetical protein